MNNRLRTLTDAVSLALDSVKDPATGKGLIAAGRIQGLSVNETGHAGFSIECPAGQPVGPYHLVRAAAESAVRETAGISGVTAVLTAQTAPEATRGRSQPAPATSPGLPGVGALIAVASAKGGVGKSTVAVNLACAFAALGLRTGLLDADVYGPSAPTLLGTVDSKAKVSADKKILPVEAFGLKTMSIGYLVAPDAPMIWRGPMATGALRQMMDEVAWAPLDILVLDLPPGTGDVTLTLLQRAPLNGAIIVSTPQEVALADVRRGVGMFEKAHAPLLGIVENMAYFQDSGGARVPIFGEGGARRTAEALGAPFLGEIPIDVALRRSGDEGRPLMAADPESETAQCFRQIAQAALDQLARGEKPPPTIRFA